MNTDGWSRAPGHPPSRVTNNTVDYMQPAVTYGGLLFLVV